MLDHYWRRFCDELIPTMHRFHHFQNGTHMLNVGDVVALLEKNKRGVWPLGKITKTFPNKNDGQVRTVELLCNGKIFKRSTRSLMLLLPT